MGDVAVPIAAGEALRGVPVSFQPGEGLGALPVPFQHGENLGAVLVPFQPGGVRGCPSPPRVLEKIWVVSRFFPTMRGAGGCCGVPYPSPGEGMGAVPVSFQPREDSGVVLVPFQPWSLLLKKPDIPQHP